METCGQDRAFSLFWLHEVDFIDTHNTPKVGAVEGDI